MKVMPGSRYEEFKKELLRIEFESKLERKILSDDDFRQACLDYLRLGQAGSDPVPAKYENQVFACYSCGKTVTKPQIVQGAEGIAGFHKKCIHDEALGHVMPGKVFCDFMPPKRAN